MRDIPGRIRRDITGKPITVGDVTIVPTIRATGWSLGIDQPAGGVGAWSVHVMPGPVTVRAADGRETTLQLTAAAGPTRRRLVGVGVGGALCAVIIALPGAARQPQPSGDDRGDHSKTVPKAVSGGIACGRT
jgi:hypothetical protein